MKTSAIRVFCAGLLLLLGLLLETAEAAPVVSPPHWFWGCWVVTTDLPTSGISGLSQKQVNTIIGMRLVFMPSYARSGHTAIQSPKYSVNIQTKQQFFGGSYVSLNQIGVHKKQVTEVIVNLPLDLSDLDFSGADVFLRRKNKDIVIEVEGDYLVAEKAKPGDAVCVWKAAKTGSSGKFVGRNIANL